MADREPERRELRQAALDWRQRALTAEAEAERDRKDADSVAIQRDDLRERLDRIRAAAESDPDLPGPLRSFLLRETEAGWLHVTPTMLDRFRATGSHHADGAALPRKDNL
jgi:hypothetical protein